MSITFFECETWEKAYFEKQLPGHTLSFFDGPLTEEQVEQITESDILCVFIYSHVQKNILEKLPNIKLIATRSTGFDHIDTTYCREKNIEVANVPTYGTNTVAEHTFALILALSRKIIPSVERTRRGDFSLDNLRGFDLYGKTLGVIGAGNIGNAVIHIAQGFGMQVLAFTKHPDESQAKQHNFTNTSLEALLKESDIITLHLPYNQETRHIINTQNIDLCKKGSLLINTARGGLIETEALLKGLESGHLAGVGIDVLEEECDIKEERQLLTTMFLKECDLKTQLLNHVLLTKENVLITPHNAFNSNEALHRILEVTVANIQSFAANKPQNIVV